MNIFYKYAMEYKVLRNKSQHHITIFTLLFRVWKPLEKPKKGKPVQQSDMDFIIEKIWNFYNQLLITQTWRSSTQQNHWTTPAKTQHTSA